MNVVIILSPSPSSPFTSPPPAQTPHHRPLPPVRRLKRRSSHGPGVAPVAAARERHFACHSCVTKVKNNTEAKAKSKRVLRLKKTAPGRWRRNSQSTAARRWRSGECLCRCTWQYSTMKKRGDERSFRNVADYSMPNVSDKVVRIIVSYVDYIKRVVWSEQ